MVCSVQDHTGTTVSLLSGPIVFLKGSRPTLTPTEDSDFYMWDTILAVFFIVSTSATDRNRVWVDDVAMISPATAKRIKQNTRVVTLLHPRKRWRGASAKQRAWKRDLERCEIPWWWLVAFSKEQTCCIPLGINWPERHRRNNTVILLLWKPPKGDECVFSCTHSCITNL